MFEIRENWWFGQGKVREKSGKSTLNFLWPPCSGHNISSVSYIVKMSCITLVKDAASVQTQ